MLTHDQALDRARLLVAELAYHEPIAREVERCLRAARDSDRRYSQALTAIYDALNLPASDRTPERAVAEVRRLVGQDWGGDLRGLAAREAQ